MVNKSYSFEKEAERVAAYAWTSVDLRTWWEELLLDRYGFSEEREALLAGFTPEMKANLAPYLRGLGCSEEAIAVLS